MDSSSRAAPRKKRKLPHLYMVYQPVVHLATGRILGHEALLRATDGTPPLELFARAASRRDAVFLDMRCLLMSLREYPQWPLRRDLLFVNVDPYTWLAGGSPVRRRVSRLLASAAPVRIVLELSERSPYLQEPSLRSALDLVRERGGLIALDDFGTGFSQLTSYLHLGPDVLKLDRSFVQAAHTSTRHRAVVQATAQLARDEGILLVAEGVETATQRDLLLSVGVEYGQGCFLGRPFPILGPTAARLPQPTPGREGEATEDPTGTT